MPMNPPDSDNVEIALAQEESKNSRAPAVERATRLLSLLETAPLRRFGISEISRALQIPKSTVLNICNALLEAQFVRRSDDGYQLGRRLVQLGTAYVSSVQLVQEFYEACKVVPPEIQAMVQLAVLSDGLEAIYLARQDFQSGLQLGLRGEIGRRTPANCTGIGKALLAALPAHELNARIAGLRSLPTLTERSISDPDALRAELERIQKAGYALDDEEVLPGIACIACNIITLHRDDGVIAVSITARKETQSPEMFELRRDALFDLADSLDRLL